MIIVKIGLVKRGFLLATSIFINFQNRKKSRKIEENQKILIINQNIFNVISHIYFCLIDFWIALLALWFCRFSFLLYESFRRKPG